MITTTIVLTLAAVFVLAAVPKLWELWHDDIALAAGLTALMIILGHYVATELLAVWT